MTTNKRERERLREAMSKSLATSPKRHEEIAEMVRGRIGPPSFVAAPAAAKIAPAQSEAEECHFCGERVEDLSTPLEAAWGECEALGADQRERDAPEVRDGI